MAAAGVIAGREQWWVDEGGALERLRLLPEGCVHCCATSPPYFSLRDYGVAGQIGLEETPALYCARLVEVFREVRRVLRDDGVFWLNVGDSYGTGETGRVDAAEKYLGLSAAQARCYRAATERALVALRERAAKLRAEAGKYQAEDMTPFVNGEIARVLDDIARALESPPAPAAAPG